MNEELKAKILKMSLKDVEERLSQIATEAKSDSADIDALTQEVEVLNERKASIAEEAKKRSKLLEGLAQNTSTATPVEKTATRTAVESPTASMEYRKAFKEYVQRGKMDPILKRSDTAGASTDLGVLIPQTVIQKVIKKLDGVYGQLYSRVRKTNIQGGVKYPVGEFSAKFTRITETTKSDRQPGGKITGSVEFSYNIGEIRLARTLLQSVLSVDVFETELAEVIVKAYVKAMDSEIVNGNPSSNQLEGIITDANKNGSGKIKTTNVIEFTATDAADWTAWQKKLFAKIPLAMRGMKPEFVMTADTYESVIKTLKDANDRPVYSETFSPVDGTEICKFKGRDVVLVEEDIFKSFDAAANGEYFGMLWVPEEAYAINSNMEFTMMHYYDHELNQYVDKALVINDGKILDGQYIYMLKKKV